MIKRTLMQCNRELVDFEVDPATGDARIVDTLEADGDPFALSWLIGQGQDKMIGKLVRARTISVMREDDEDIVAAFGAKSAVDLVLMGHGLSLSDQYWYRAPGSTERWEDINFFDNEWDPDFGTAVFKRDYARLATCSPDVPDVTTPGHAVKTWERNDGIFLIKAPLRPDSTELIGAKLASGLCALLFDEGCYLPVDIVERHGTLCTASPLMLERDEELADGHRIYSMTGMCENSDENTTFEKKCDARIEAYTALGIADASAHVAKLACLSCLSLLADFHAGNYGAIHKIGSDTWRPAPVFDYDGSFGFPFVDDIIPKLCASPPLALLLCAQSLSYLSPSWDWSWYDPQAIEGFEERILEAYASCQNMPPNFGELVANLFVVQREYVDKIASAK